MNLARRLGRRAGVIWSRIRAAFIARDTGQIRDTSHIADRRIAEITERLNAITAPMWARQTSIGAWEISIAAQLRRLHLQMFALGRGGWDRIARRDWRIVEARLATEFSYLERLALDISAGRVSLAEVLYRLSLYARDARTTYFEGARAAKDDAGYTQERRVLNPAEHCSDCVLHAAKGWRPIGSLPLPGDDSQCISNCRCGMEYR